MWGTPNTRATYKTKGCQLGKSYDNSIITGPITLKLRMHVGTHISMSFHESQLGCYCTRARARQWSFQISRTAGPIALKLGVLMGID